MSKNYNKYYNKTNNEHSEYRNAEKLVDPEEVLEEETIVEAENEPETDAEVYEVESQYSSIDVPEEEVVEKRILFYGINNCSKLNVRTEPSKDADVVCVLTPADKFEIEELESDPEWVKVFLENGDVGFCMKMYVAIR